MNTFLIHTLHGYGKRLLLIVLIDVAEVFFSLGFVWFSKIIIDVATGVQTGELARYALLLVGLLAVQIGLRILDVRLRNITEVHLGSTIRSRVFAHLMYVSWSKLPSMHSGDMLSRLTRDTDELAKALVTALPLVISAGVQLVGAVILLFFFDPLLAIILGAGIPLLTLAGKLYYVRMRKYTHEIKESESRITSMVEESLLNQLVIRTFERQEENIGKLDTLQNQLKGQINKRTNVSVYANLLMYID